MNFILAHTMAGGSPTQVLTIYAVKTCDQLQPPHTIAPSNTQAVQCKMIRRTEIFFFSFFASNDLNIVKSCQCHRDVTVRKLVGSSPRLLFTHRSWQSYHHCHPSWYQVLGHFAIVCLPLVPVQHPYQPFISFFSFEDKSSFILLILLINCKSVSLTMT